MNLILDVNGSLWTLAIAYNLGWISKNHEKLIISTPDLNFMIVQQTQFKYNVSSIGYAMPC